MTDRELMQQALGALEGMAQDLGKFPAEIPAITAIKEALAQPEQEPVAWLSWNDKDGYGYWDTKAEADLNCAGDTEPEPLYTAPQPKQPEPVQEPVAWLVQYSNKHEFVWGQKPQWIADAIGIEPLYTTPQPRQWVGLTDEEVKALPQWFPSHETAAVLPLIFAVEAKLREKNA